MGREGLPWWPVFVGVALVAIVVAGGMGLILLREQPLAFTVAPATPVPRGEQPRVDGGFREAPGAPPAVAGAEEPPQAGDGGRGGWQPAAAGGAGGGVGVLPNGGLPGGAGSGPGGRTSPGPGGVPEALTGLGAGAGPWAMPMQDGGPGSQRLPGPDGGSAGDFRRPWEGEPGPGFELPERFPRPDGTRGPAADPGPRIALIIDDWGYDWEAADAFLSFPEPLTIAVLPHLPRSVEQALRAQAAGFEVIVHMPMEPLDPSLDMGPGGIAASMADEDIVAAVRAALAAVPGARGLNNHMGSRATADPRVMRAALQVLAEEGLFFVDSYTAASTVGFRVAHEMQLPYAVNQVFLDHVDDEEAIRRQIRRLMRLALEQGAAVGIGHVRPRTFAALVDMLPEIRAAGIRLVPVSQLLTRPGREGLPVAGLTDQAAPPLNPEPGSAVNGSGPPADPGTPPASAAEPSSARGEPPEAPDEPWTAPGEGPADPDDPALAPDAPALHQDEGPNSVQ